MIITSYKRKLSSSPLISMLNSVKKVLLLAKRYVAAWLLRFVKLTLLERYFNFHEFSLRLAGFRFLHKISGSYVQSVKVLFGVLQNCTLHEFYAIMVLRKYTESGS